MKITLNWFREYVDFQGTPEDLAAKLTLLGLEVEGMEKRGGAFEGIVVGEVLTREKHPNADKLSLCRVRDGAGERQIVCGAVNFKPGDKVPLILPGASLPLKPGEDKPFTIKVGKIRGVESQGMMCSAEELNLDPATIGLKKEEDGLLILKPEARTGQSFAEYLGLPGGDVVYDLEVTPNRPDWNSVIGIAREISALTGSPLRLPDLDRVVVRPPGSPETENEPRAVDDRVGVRIEAGELCPRYVARIVEGVRIGPSPDWLRRRLESVGLRSLGNVVDVTNFVMLETGQPLHAFDYRLLDNGARGKPVIVVRRAAPDERFTTLDGQERVLNSGMLLIADEQKPLALAGVMGGRNSEIHEQTTDVLVESASFQPSNIRRTSKALSLRTEASHRFERGVDPNLADWASRRCVQLILETAGGRALAGGVDAFPGRRESSTVTLRHGRVGALLGVEIPREEQIQLLKRLGLETVEPGIEAVATAQTVSVDSSTFRIPSFRPDLKEEADLIEEVCRLYGVDRIPSARAAGGIGGTDYDSVHDELDAIRRTLTSLGLTETCGQTLISSASPAVARMGSEEVLVKLENPLSADMNALRPGLLPGLLDALRRNAHHQQEDVALFEIGRAFTRGHGAIRQQLRLGLVMTGRRDPGFWAGADREAGFDAFDLKGVVESLLERCGVQGAMFSTTPNAGGLYLESATVSLGGKRVFGEMGRLHPGLMKAYDARHPVWMAEIDLEPLLGRRRKAASFRALPLYPGIRRDVAMLLPESILHEQVLEVVKQARLPDLERVEIFDVFRGASLPQGRKSVAYAFSYRNPDRTLSDAEVNSAHSRLIEEFRNRLGATIR